MVNVTGTEKMLFSVMEAGEAIGLSRSTIYDLMESGALTWTAYGAKRLIVGDSLRTFVQRLIDGAYRST